MGVFYEGITQILGFKNYGDEYKVMGLAPYYTGSKREEVEKIFDKMLTLDGIEFHFNKEIPDIFNFLENNFLVAVLWPNAKRFDTHNKKPHIFEFFILRGRHRFWN